MPEAFLIAPTWIAPVAPNPQLLRDHAVVVEGSRIAAVLPRQQAVDAYPDATEIALDGHLLTPGFVNLHSHAAMSLLRGIGDDLPLTRWLEERIWPAEARAHHHRMRPEQETRQQPRAGLQEEPGRQGAAR